MGSSKARQDLDLLETPAWVYEPLGSIDLDPCAGAGTNIAATNYRITNGRDGLALPWGGLCSATRRSAKSRHG